MPFVTPRILTVHFYLALTLATASGMAASKPASSPFRGTAALADTRRAVSYSERPAGSEANAKQRAWILSELKPLGGELTSDSFVAQTPTGPIPMVNILLRFPGTSDKAIAITGHYDTKKIPMVHFVGANDGGSSTGFLIEFARAISTSRHPDDIYIVFFDGEEALGTWSDTDSRYGSRHLADKWLAAGLLPHLKALINIDMIGDKELDLSNDENSSVALRTQLTKIADRLGYAKYLRRDPGAVDDDHKPFADVGVNVLDVIDLDYGPNGSYWHTAADTMDKLSVRSFQIVGDLVWRLVEELEKS